MRRPPFRMVLFGLGHAGTHLHLPALSRLRGVELVAAYDPDASRRAATSAPTVADEEVALDIDADAVIIATPPETHAGLVLAAMERGRHVYVEKPMAHTSELARAIAERAQDTRRCVQVGYAYRFHPLWQRVHRLVRRGRLRLPVHAEGVFDGPLGVGWDHPLVNVACHHVDLISWLTSSPPTTVEVRDGQSLHARWPDGSTLTGRYGPGPGRDQMSLGFGPRTVSVDRRGGLRLRGAGPLGAVPSPSLVRAQPGHTGWERSFERALRSFVASTTSGSPPAPGPREGEGAVAVGEATIRALTEGREVAVDAGPAQGGA